MLKFTTHLKIRRNLKFHFPLISLLKELIKQGDGKNQIVSFGWQSFLFSFFFGFISCNNFCDPCYLQVLHSVGDFNCFIR